jgi:OH-DDVA oxygenase/3-O-methylgallate 3,4-dioxygenase
MARTILGLWTTHGPTLSTTPEQWLLRLPADHARKDHPFRGKTYDFPTLVALRHSEGLIGQATLAERSRRKRAGIHEAEAGHNPSVYTEYPGLPELADHLIGAAIADQFDIARANRLPEHPGHWNSGIGHAFGFVYRQIMRDRVIPHVPIITNTFFPPNQPSARRCFELGRSVGRALKAWDSDQTVAVIGSGGMSHFVIDEQFDRLILDAIQTRDADKLCAIGEDRFQSGTSELKNWIAAAGALFETGLSGGLIDYQPCYRSEAGTGTANGFVVWS